MLSQNRTPDEVKNCSLFQLIKYSLSSEQCMKSVKSMDSLRPMKFNVKFEAPFNEKFKFSDLYPTHTITLTIFHGEQLDNNRSLSENVHIHIVDDNLRFGVKKKMNFNGLIVRTDIEEENHIYTYWEIPIRGICHMLDYFSNLFNSPPIYELKLGDKTADRREITSWIKKNRGSEVEYLNLDELNLVTSKEMNCMLRKVKPTALTLNWITQRDFRCELPRDLKFFSCSSDWLTKADLLNMNYELIDIEAKKISYQDISDFTTKCIEGGLPALQYCKIKALDLECNFAIIANGIGHNKTSSSLKVEVENKNSFISDILDFSNIFMVSMITNVRMAKQ
ncbi:hypothetical protein CAEBREN_03815 [Caenorhabditis brenneri]|uniref:Sdz-33 F-box domain-containing protein n=1 Tax=Caenorhabditis brenneri TaxID=135651 RepID=G0PEU4_CAEBE|nr:hypothetical protein CAEBREN_03815 [Caenorhabditis brenneri]